MNEVAEMPRGEAVGNGEQIVSNDGRNRRAAETRRKVIEAAKAMITETSIAPTVVGVAKRADVSVRSVFQHFGDVESLFVTVVDSVRKNLVVPPETSEAMPFSERVDSFSRNMGQLYDQIVPMRVAAGQFVGHPGLEERGLAIQNSLRDSAFRVFAPEFGLLSDDGKESLADAITASLSLDAWISLRRRQNLSFERAVAAWRLTLGALLAAPSMRAAAE
jgi:AcrR family transcriptional regulator